MTGSSGTCLTQFDLMMKLASNKKKTKALKVHGDQVVSGSQQLTEEGHKMDPFKTNLFDSEDEELGLKDFKMKAKSIEQQAKERLRDLQKIWSATQKYILSQCSQGRCIDLPLAGRFKRIGEENGQPLYAFMPHLDMIGSGNFSFPENDSNVSPFSKSSAAFGHSV